MTRNQILYQQQVETRRANLANEALTSKRDAETARSNLAREVETNRHNVRTEDETERSHRAVEAETNRSNLAKELETVRHNQSSEQLAREQLAETQRSNLAAEIEANRTHMVNEAENRRYHEEAVEQQREAAKLNAVTQRYVANTHAESAEYSADRNYQASTERNQSQEQQNMLSNQASYDRALVAAASNEAIEELRQRGYDKRQLVQIGADAINVLHDDILAAIKHGGNVKSTIKELIFNWAAGRLWKGDK